MGGFESSDSELHGRYRVNREILCVVKVQYVSRNGTKCT